MAPRQVTMLPSHDLLPRHVTPRYVTPRYVIIDGLRGLAALSVVLYHAFEGGHLAMLAPLLPAPLAAVLRWGHTGTAAFFVISGFVIAHSVGPASVDGGFVARFAARRAIRLDPPYWASIVLTLALGALAARLVPGRDFALPPWPNLLAHLTYTQVLFDLDLVNDVYWTLCLEVQFYLTFVLMFWAVTRVSARFGRERATDFALGAALLVADLWPLGIVTSAPVGLFVSFWHLFLTGAVVWRAVTVRVGRRAWVPYLLTFVHLTALALGALRGPATERLLVCIATGAFVLVAGLAGKLHRWLSWRAVQHLGLVSYSLYLTHNVLSGALFRVGFRLTPRSPATEALWLLVMLAVCIGFATLMYRLVERPSIALSQRITRHARAEPGVAAPPVLPQPADAPG